MVSPATIAQRRLEMLPDLLTRKEAADYLGVAPQTMARWAVEGVGPVITKIGGRHVRYSQDAIRAFTHQTAA